MRVHDVADFADRWLENAVRRGIRHHERGEIASVFVGLGAQIGKVDVAIFQTRNRDNLESRHHRAGRVGPMRRGGDEAYVAMRFTARGMIFTNREQTCEFTLRAGVGLQ